MTGVEAVTVPRDLMRRRYWRTGAIVSCYDGDGEGHFSDNPSWVMTFVDEQHAKDLMEDLSWAEYDGA